MSNTRSADSALSSDPPPKLEERLRPYLWAMLAVAIGVALREAVTPVVGTALPYITLFPAVFVAAYLGGLGPAVLATILSVLAALYWFVEPRHGLSLGDPVAQFGAVIFVVTGILNGWLGQSRLNAHRRASGAIRVAKVEAARAEEEAVRAEEEATRAE